MPIKMFYFRFDFHRHNSFTPVVFEPTRVSGPRSMSFLSDLGRVGLPHCEHHP